MVNLVFSGNLIMRFPNGNLMESAKGDGVVRRRKNRTAPPPEICPLTACMTIIGGAWTPNILWYLREGPRRFSELKSDVSGVGAKVLAARLRRLERDSVVSRMVMPTSPPTVEYRLTTFGLRLIPAIEAIVEVGHEIKTKRPGVVRK